MKKRYAKICDQDGTEQPVFDIAPDLADHLLAALRRDINVTPPRHATEYNELVGTIAQTTRVIQHLEAFRELAIVKADATHPLADRKGIAIAAAMPPSRLYRLLEKYGRPKNRAKAYDTALGDAIDKGLRGEEMWKQADRVSRPEV